MAVDPLAPVIATCSPGDTEKETSSTAIIFPYPHRSASTMILAPVILSVVPLLVTGWTLVATQKGPATGSDNGDLRGELGSF